MTEEPTTYMKGFARSIGQGMNQADAYRANYDVSNMSAAAIYVEASRLANHPKVSLMIANADEVVETSLQAKRVHTAESLVDYYEAIYAGAMADRQWAPANRATEGIARLTGNLEPTPATEVRITKVTIVLPSDTKIVDVSEYKVDIDTETEV